MTIDSVPEVITVRIKDACRMTGIGRSKLYELIAAGEIEIVKVGAMTLIPVDSLRQLTGAHTRKGNEP
ncbi:MAG TPA: helix-turn-helix domain-containing protein [Sphingomicrobium sp.]|nr:helix-turn-helix domain-containing protein [Sphingomicrobium sp.]